IIENTWSSIHDLRSTRQLKKDIAEHFPGGPPRATRPALTRWQGYARACERKTEEEVRRGPFEANLIVLTRKDEQRVLGLEATLPVTPARRNAAIKAAGENVPGWLSGHQLDGSPALRPHLAFFPLPFVGAKHADGHVMGLAIAIPREFDRQGDTR